MRIYYDTEFTNLDADASLISAGFVAENGCELYFEIEDFNRLNCSQFVIDSVLPLLGKIPGERIQIRQLGHKLASWLGQFNDDVELISDAKFDYWLIEHHAQKEIRSLPARVRDRVWYTSENPCHQVKLAEVEEQFWQENPGMEHHALLDARRLKLIADTQRKLLAQS